MQHKQLLFQRAVLLAALVLTCLTFVIALGYATDIYSLNYHADAGSKLLYVKGAELYYQIQPFNQALLRDAAVLVVLCLFMFIFFAHKRRLYYLSNYVTTIAYCGFAGYLAATLLANSLFIKNKYLQIDFERLREVTDMLNMRYAESTFMLDAACVLSILLFVLVACLLINLIWKTAWMRKERKLTAEGGDVL